MENYVVTHSNDSQDGLLGMQLSKISTNDMKSIVSNKSMAFTESFYEIEKLWYKGVGCFLFFFFCNTISCLCGTNICTYVGTYRQVKTF